MHVASSNEHDIRMLRTCDKVAFKLLCENVKQTCLSFHVVNCFVLNLKKGFDFFVLPGHVNQAHRESLCV